MISINALLRRRSDFAVQNWILDSGAFTRITSGRGHLEIADYASAIARWSSCGNLMVAVTQDYMCEPFVLGITGKTVLGHQRLTIKRYDALKQELEAIACDTYLMPVLQGYQVDDYLAHLEQYGDRLSQGDWVGVGSVCKRNGSPREVEKILLAIKDKRPDLRLHGFGLKRTALESSLIWDLLYSADSAAAGLSTGRGSQKYLDAHNPRVALEYASAITSQPRQLTIWSSLYA